MRSSNSVELPCCEQNPQSTTIHQNDELEHLLSNYFKQLYKKIGPQRELVGCGNCLTKIHGLLHFPGQIRMFGPSQGFNGAPLESHLKVRVKRPTDRTTRQHDRFGLDIVSVTLKVWQLYTPVVLLTERFCLVPNYVIYSTITLNA